jgi:hypothetical protein
MRQAADSFHRGSLRSVRIVAMQNTITGAMKPPG